MFFIIFATLIQLLVLCPAAPALTTRSSGSKCLMVKSYPDAPKCPGGCCGWRFDMPGPSTWCKDSSPVIGLDIDTKPDNWVVSCTNLKEMLLQNGQNYVINQYQVNTFHPLVTWGNCNFEVSIPLPPQSDTIEITTADIYQFVDEAISTSNNGAQGATGTSTCWAISMTWRIVPPGN